MSGPTLSLGISASGVEQMRALAQATEQFDRALASLQTRGAGSSTAQLGGLAALTSEVQKIRQSLGEAAAGLRTELADLKENVGKALTDAFNGVSKTAQQSSKKAADETAAALDDAAKKEKSAIDKYTASMMVGSAKIVETQGTAAAREEAARVAWLAKMQTGSAKISDQVASSAEKEEAARLAWLAKMQVGSAKISDQVASSADKEEAARLAWLAKMQVGSAKISDQIATTAEKEEAARLAWIARMQVGSAKIVEAQGANAAREEAARLAWTAKMQVGSARIAEEMSAAAATEEAARAALTFRAQKSLQTFLQQREDEAAKVALAAAKVEAAYAALSERQQLRRQLQARTQLDTGIPEATVAGSFGSTAVAAAQLSTAAALRAEMEKMGPSAHGASLGAISLADALGKVRVNSGVAREGLALVDEALQNRFKNMAGTAVVLLNRMGLAPFIFQASTLAIVAAGAAALVTAAAFATGSVELSNFTKQATLTGDAVGISASQFTRMRDSLEGVAVTKGKAAEALTEIASTGLRAGQSVEMIATTAILMERAVGAPLKNTIKQFEELEKSPVEASIKLNEQYNYLTASVYSQIKALAEHGKTQEAADLAEKTYADSMSQRAQQIIDGQGIIERGWHAVANAAKGAWDAMLDLGRQDSMADKLGKAAIALDAAKRRLQSNQEFTTTESGAAIGLPGRFARASTTQAGVDTAQSVFADAFRRSEIESGNPIAAQQRIDAARARIEFEKFNYKTADQTRIEKRDLEIERIKTTGAISGASQADIDARVAAVMERQTPKGRGGSANLASTLQGKGAIADSQSALYRQLMDTDNTTPISKLTEAEKQLLMIEAKIPSAKDATTLANLRSAEATAKETVAKEQSAKQTEVQHDLWLKDLKYIDDVTKANDRSAESITARAQGIEEENKHWGKNKTAIEESTLAELQKQLAEADATDTFDPKYVASLDKKTAAQQRYVAALQEAEAHAATSKLNEALRASNEDTRTIQTEYDLVGKTANERARILATRKSETVLAKDLADIDKLNLGTGPEADTKRTELQQLAYQKARVDGMNATNKIIVSEWQKTTDQIETGLTDAIMAGFESGKSFAKSLRDYFKSLFNTLVLRPIIQAIVAPAAGALGGAATNYQQMLTGGNGGGGIGGMFNSASSLYSSGSTLYTVGSQYFGGTMSGANAAGTLYGNVAGGAYGGGLDALLATNGAYGTAAGVGTAGAAGGLGYGVGAAGAGSAGALGGAGAATGADLAVAYGGAEAAGGAAAGAGAGAAAGAAVIPVIGWVIAIAAILYSIFGGKGGGPKTEGTYNPYNSDQYYTSNSAEVQKSAKQAVQPLQASYDSLALALGGKTGLQLGLGFSMDPKGKAPTQLQIGAGLNGNTVFNMANTNVGRDEKDLQDAIAKLGSRAILAGMQQADLPGKFGDWLRGLNIMGMADDEIGDAMGRVQKVATERSSLETRLFNMTGTALEKLNKQRAAERLAIDVTNKELLEQVYAQEDLVQAGQNLLTAYGNQTQQINDLRAYAKELKSWVNEALVGDNSPLSLFEQLAQAGQQFNDTLALAHGGDTDARSALPGTASTYLTSLKNTSATRVDYAMGFSKVASAMALEAADAESKATVMDQQLTVAKEQLVALGLINDNVQTFEQAWAAFTGAQDALATAKAAAEAAATAAAQVAAPPVSVYVTPATSQPAPYVTVEPDSNYGGSSAGGAAGGGGDGGAYAFGGYHLGGVRLVGENGPEIEATGPSYIHDAAATRRLLGGGSQGKDDTLCEEVRGLRIEMRANVASTAQLSKDFRELKNRGFPVTNTNDGVTLKTN